MLSIASSPPFPVGSAAPIMTAPPGADGFAALFGAVGEDAPLGGKTLPALPVSAAASPQAVAGADATPGDPLDVLADFVEPVPSRSRGSNHDAGGAERAASEAVVDGPCQDDLRPIAAATRQSKRARAPGAESDDPVEVAPGNGDRAITQATSGSILATPAPSVPVALVGHARPTDPPTAMIPAAVEPREARSRHPTLRPTSGEAPSIQPQLAENGSTVRQVEPKIVNPDASPAQRGTGPTTNQTPQASPERAERPATVRFDQQRTGVAAASTPLRETVPGGRPEAGQSTAPEGSPLHRAQPVTHAAKAPALVAAERRSAALTLASKPARGPGGPTATLPVAPPNAERPTIGATAIPAPNPEPPIFQRLPGDDGAPGQPVRSVEAHVSIVRTVNVRGGDGSSPHVESIPGSTHDVRLASQASTKPVQPVGDLPVPVDELLRAADPRPLIAPVSARTFAPHVNDPIREPTRTEAKPTAPAAVGASADLAPTQETSAPATFEEQPAAKPDRAHAPHVAPAQITAARVAPQTAPPLDTAARLVTRPAPAPRAVVRVGAMAEPPEPTLTTAAALAATATAAAAAPTAPPPLDMTRHTWPAAMIARIERLRDEADAVSTTIRVIPDALGAIDVSLRKDGEVTHVHLAAEQPQTRALLADASPKLAELAEQRGLKLGDAQVQAGPGSNGGQQSAPQPTPRRTATPPPTAAPARAESSITDDRIA